MIQSPGAPSRRVKMAKSPFRIGSSDKADLVIEDPELESIHLEIRADRSGYAEAKAIGEVKVLSHAIHGSRMLNSGDRLTLGKHTLLFQSTIGKSKDQELVAKSEGSGPPPFEARKQDTPASNVVSPVNERLFALQKKLHRELIDNLDLKRLDMTQVSTEDMRQRSEHTLRKLMSELNPSELVGVSPPKVIKDVINHALGLGPLEELLENDDVTEIMVNNFDRIYVEQSGKLTLSGVRFMDNAQVIEVIRRIIAPIGRRIDETNPMVDARLQDGSRVNAIIPPLAISGPSITIRKFAKEPFAISDLVGFGSLTENMGKFLKICVEHRKNIVISGGTGSGKTTLLGVISANIPDGDRIVTIEDAAELRLPQDHVVSLESKPPNLEGQGAIPIRKLVINSLRMRPDRIVVGECRGAEALDMLQAMNTGHDGSLTTLHANTCRDAISRLETMVLMAGMNLPSKAIVEQISSAVDIIVQTNRFPDGTRKISSISVVDGMEGEKITLQEIFAYNMTGYSEKGKVEGSYGCEGGVPSFCLELQQRGIKLDLSIFR
jgi:pilus assembly protein CpaF